MKAKIVPVNTKSKKYKHAKLVVSGKDLSDFFDAGWDYRYPTTKRLECDRDDNGNWTCEAEMTIPIQGRHWDVYKKNDPNARWNIINESTKVGHVSGGYAKAKKDAEKLFGKDSFITQYGGYRQY